MSTNLRLFVAAGLLVGLGLALLVSPFASSAPDGLETVAAEEGFDEAATAHDLASGPMADYAVAGLEQDRMSTAVAGVVGTLVTFGIGVGLFAALASGVGERASLRLVEVDSGRQVAFAPPQCRVAGTILFVFAVVATPRHAVGALIGQAALAVTVAAAAGVSLRRLAASLRLLAPFVAFALLLPLVASGVRTEFLGRSLSVSGLWAAWNIVAKATIAVTASVVLTTTTPAPEIIVGLDRLRVPRALTAIAGFMLRYRDVLAGELRQMRIARLSRGYDPRWLWQARAVGTSAGALFLRAYERGERVHLAMLSRGFTGTMPPLRSDAATPADWAAALGPALAAAALAVAGVVGDVNDVVVDLHDVAFAYPDGRQALVGCSLQVRAGERVAVLGANGSGKTTLALHLNGVLAPAAGTVVVEGLPVSGTHLREVRRRVAIVFQDPDDQLFMPTVAQDVAFGPANLGLTGDDLAARVEGALAAVGMTGVADRAPHHLSVGQRRRVAVATVLAMEPSILVLDEPSANLDPAAKAELADVLASLDLTLVMVTHDLPYALQLCDRALVMHEGRIVADGPVDAILDDAELLAANRLALPFGYRA